MFWFVDIDYKHPDGRRERVRRVSPVQTRRGAEQYERDLRNELLGSTCARKEKKQNQIEEKKVPTLSKFADEFVGTYAVNNNKPSEVAAKKWALKNHLVPFLGKHRLDGITVRDIERFKGEKIKAELSPKTINNILSVLRRLLAVAKEWGIIAQVPTIKPLKTSPPDFDFLTFEEAERLMAYQQEPSWWAMIVVALKTGMRLGELRALRWDDVDLVSGLIVVRRAAWKDKVGTPKSGRTRELPLSDVALRALKAHRHLRGELVFCNADGSMLTKEQNKWPLWRACKRAGLRRIGWKVCRHTFASHLVMKGAPLKAVQELMGHATIEMTMRYAHLSPDVRKDVVQLLDRDGRHSYGNIAATEVAPDGKA